MISSSTCWGFMNCWQSGSSRWVMSDAGGLSIKLFTAVDYHSSGEIPRSPNPYPLVLTCQTGLGAIHPQ